MPFVLADASDVIHIKSPAVLPDASNVIHIKDTAVRLSVSRGPRRRPAQWLGLLGSPCPPSFDCSCIIARHYSTVNWYFAQSITVHFGY